MALLIPTLLFYLLSLPLLVPSKSTIEPCSVSDSCNALVGYTLYTELKVSEVAALFQVDPVALLNANAIDISIPDVENHILPAGLFTKIPTICSCTDGIRKSVSTRYRTRPSDTLSSIADTVYAGLASADQIREANSITDPSVLEVGQILVIPLPCTCFNSSDNFLPAIYLSYVVLVGDTVPGIAARYSTTVTDIMNVNAMGSPVVRAGDILAIPLPACASSFPRYASDHGLTVANGSYAITASHCVQCSCGPGNLNLYCTPASLAVSCSSMQCRGSNLILGNVTAQATSAGCNVTSCSYGGFVNGTILTTLSTSLQPRCPGPLQFPSVVPPPTFVSPYSFLAPSPSPIPSQPGGAMPTPKTSFPGTFSLPGVSPASGPAGSTSQASAIKQLNHFVNAIVLCLLLKFM
ncbi:lysM domain-containing GPI-anchored protein 1 [Dendrobium catenatum]|uniref:LysM domain-containing GPI-anchored protein 1 n=1 Tax=Dendrobium catenatum TaxID=906689 RepID=A0A2I0W553_9ASPA|nr:lysM domain-containing GPI-anchored protein 1 [Dendrobium catenatum]PKU70780.1 LysM domain-containing GPI-anchored protein 1 [Dendrobium catenatum]